MANNVDKRVVEMQFDNAQFEKGVETSTKSLDKLKESLDFSGVEKKKAAFSNILKFTGVTEDVEKTASAFQAFKNHVPAVMKTAGKAMLGFGIAATGTLTGIGTALGGLALKGGITRAMNLKQADFMLQGLVKDEKAVAAIMDNVSESVDGTAYSLDQAALVASQFAATGMRGGEQMLNALKGVAGAAAVFGADYQRVGQIFTQVSGQGRLMGNDLLQLSGYGMNAAATLADYFKTVKGEAGTTEAEIRDMVSKGKIDFETFAEAMNWAFGDQAAKANETFTGALSNVKAALSRIGEKVASPAIDALRDFFNTVRPLINEINTALTPSLEALGDKIKKVSSFFTELGLSGKTSLKDILKFDTKEGINSFSTIEKYFKLVNDGTVKASDDITKFAKKIKKEGKLSEEGIRELVKNGEISFEMWNTALNKVFGDNKINYDQSTLGIALQGIISLFGQVKQIGSTIGDAFKDIFPGTTVETIRDIVVRFTEFTSQLKISKETISNVGSTFRGVFTIFKGFGGMLKGIGTILKPFASLFVKLLGLFFAITGRIGDMIVAIDKFNQKTGITRGIVHGIASVFDFLTTIIGGLAGVLTDVFSGFGEGFVKRMRSVSDVAANAADSFGKLQQSLMDKFPKLKGLLGRIGDGFKSFGESIGKAFKNADFSFLTDAISAGGIFVIFKSIKDFIDSLSSTFESGAGIFTAITDTLESLRATLEAYQNSLKASTLIKIAAAVAILAAAVIGLSLVNPKRLIPAMFAIEVLLFSMFRMMDALSTVGTGGLKGFGNIAKMGTLLLSVSIAVGILAGSVIALSRLSPEEVVSGLGGVAGACLILVMVANSMTTNEKRFVKGAGSMVLFAVAINILAKAVKELAKLNVKQLGKGLGSVAVLLASFVGFTRILTKGGAKKLDKVAGSIVLIGGSLYILAQAVKVLSGLSVKELGKGLGAVIILLASLAAFSNVFSKKGSIKFKAVLGELLVLAGSIYILVQAVKELGALNVNEIGRGLLGIGGSIGILVMALGAMSTMKGGVKAATSILILSAAVAVMSKSVMALSSLSLDQVGHSLLALAGGLAAVVVAVGVLSTMGVKGMAAAAMMPIIASSVLILAPALQTLGQMSLEQIGKALLAIAGAFGVLGLAALVLSPVIPAIGLLALAIAAIGIAAMAAGAGVALFAAGLAAMAALGPAAINNVVESIKNLATGIPEIFKYIGEGIIQLIQVIGDNAALMAEVGLNLLISFMNAINNNIYQITALGLQILTNLINAIADNIEPVIQAGYNLIVNFINGVANGLRENQDQILGAVANLMAAIVTFVLTAMQAIFGEIPIIGDKISDGLEKAKKSVDDKFNPDEAKKTSEKYGDGLTSGFDKAKDKAKESGEKIAKNATEGMGKKDLAKAAASGLGSAYNTTLGKAVKNTRTAGEKYPAMAAKGMSKTKDIKSSGTTSGKAYNQALGDMSDKSHNAGKKLGNKAAEGAKNKKGFNEAGTNAAAGFVSGASTKNTEAYNAGWKLASSYYDAIKKRLQEHSPSKATYKLALFAVKGFVKPAYDYSYLARNAGTNLAQAMLTGIKKNSSDIIAAADSIDLIPNQPVIRPVVDMSNVYSAAGEVGSLFNANSSVRAAASISAHDIQQENAMNRLMTSISTQLGKMAESNNSSVPMTNNFNISGAENPEDFANRFLRQLEIEMRTG